MRARRTWWIAGWALVASAPARAQTDAPVDTEPAVQLLEEYLAEHALTDILAAHLRQRLAETTGQVRTRTAERLASIYAIQLGEAKTPGERQPLEVAARELLKVVPESESSDLRINLAKASYLQAEEIAERDRLRLASPEDRAEALRILRGSLPSFEDVARRSGARVDQLEHQEKDLPDEAVVQVREQLADAVRVRSLAHYYAGWCAYYAAMLGNEPARADEAIKHFGWLLQAVPGKAPTLDKFPSTLLKYDHIARSAIGVAMCLSLKGQDVDAIRWLDQVDKAGDLGAPVRAQVFPRRVAIYAAGGRWNNILDAAERRRQPDRAKPPEPMEISEARLLAVSALEGLRQTPLTRGQRESIEAVAQVGMADLIARGEVSHVLDLVGRYGTAPIGDSGFIVQYVRGLQAYERAREAQKNAGGPVDKPSSDPGILNAYREASKMLTLALASPDAGKFAGEVPRASMRRGLSLYYAGELEESAKEFEASFSGAKNRDARRDALWYAIVALDLAVDQGRPSLAKDRDRLALIFLHNFPESDEAAKLLLRQTKSELMSDEETAKVLLAVPPESPMREASRRQAARLLYRVYRRAGGADRSFAAMRFADVGEEVMRSDAAKAQLGRDEASLKAAQSVLLAARQLADALLSQDNPDVARAQATLDLIDAVASLHTLDIGSMRAELDFRRLQIAAAKGDEVELDACLLRLRQNGGEFALAAERLMYRRALAAFKQSPEDGTLARRIVRHGSTILDNSKDPGAQGMLSIRLAVANAAAVLWRGTHDEEMLRRAVDLDKGSLASGARTLDVLKRLAELGEPAGDAGTSLDCWRELAAVLPQGEPEWFEAKYHVLRLLWKSDQPSAVVAMRQLKVLYPKMGPDPWGEKLRDLDLKMGRPEPLPKAAAGGGP